MFYMSGMIKKIFIQRPFYPHDDKEITFEDICFIDEYWHYVNLVLMENVYEHSYKSYGEKDMEKLTLLNENILIGPPRLKQKRVRNDSCVIDEILQRNFMECFGPYQHSNEDFNSFGTKNGTA